MLDYKKMICVIETLNLRDKSPSEAHEEIARATALLEEAGCVEIKINIYCLTSLSSTESNINLKQDAVIELYGWRHR
jgi:hypothetical protein